MNVNIWIMAYRIVFYNPKVAALLARWPAGIAASFTAISQSMVAHGPNLGLPYTRAMGKGLFEIRARGVEGIGRAFFCTLSGQQIVILHGFIKKSQKTPLADLRLAQKRLKELHHG
jgi:phage-related protein